MIEPPYCFASTHETTVSVLRNSMTPSLWCMTIDVRDDSGTLSQIVLQNTHTATYRDWVELAEAKKGLALTGCETVIEICGTEPVYRFTTRGVTLDVPVDRLRYNLIAVMRLMVGKGFCFRE